MDKHVAGPSRLLADYDSDSLPHPVRPWQVASNQMTERDSISSARSSFLKLDDDPSKAVIQSRRNAHIILKSPASPSKCPTSFLPWTARLATDPFVLSSVAPRAVAIAVQSPMSGTRSSVAPLNFKRSSRGKSLSIAKIETGMTDLKRDASLNVNESSKYLQASFQYQTPIEPCITRRQSLPDTSLASDEGGLKRQRRPLPPVPLSRPVSPCSSISSHTSHSSPRPLPTPPKQSPTPAVSPIIVTPASPQPQPSASLPAPSTPPVLPKLLMPTTPPKGETSNSSPISPLSIITDLTNVSRLSTVGTRSPRSSGLAARKRHHIHASPYKLSRSPTRYSTTSLSSQISVPPVPSPAELRRRNRDKMAKLIRVLGESPPSELVFASEHIGKESIEKPIAEDPLEGCYPPCRSTSLDRGEPTGVFGKYRKALSDPDAGHGVRAQSPTATRANHPPGSFLRLRSKKGRADIDKAPRYVVSLFGTAESPTPERLTFKLNASAPKMRPTGSYLRGAYKTDKKPLERKIPPLPAIDSGKQAKKWVRDDGSTRWEVDDYENVVMSLRKL